VRQNDTRKISRKMIAITIAITIAMIVPIATADAAVVIMQTLLMDSKKL